MSQPNVTYALEDGVAVIALNRPEVMNALSTALRRELRAAIARAVDEARVLVLTGTGRAFCSGQDLQDAQKAGAVDFERILNDEYVPMLRDLTDCPLPTIAAVNGAAIGAGLALAMACDIRYVADDATLAAPFTRLGMHPGMLTTWSITRAASLAVARDLLLTGRSVLGPEAVALGLASRSLPAAEVLPAALEAATAVARAAPLATRLTKQALAGDGPVSYESALQWEALAQSVTLLSADLQEWLAAQREKRRPRFTGQ